MMHMHSLENLRQAIATSWSVKTSSRWLSDNPARGQCSVTALVVQDIFGGHLLKTEAGGGWHFYNRIDGQRLDLTDGQFDAPVHYDDRETCREEAFADTSTTQYETLMRAVLLRLGR